MLTVHDVAQRLNVSVACVYALVASNELPHVRIGTRRGTIRISEDDLEVFINARRRATPPSSRSPACSPLKHLRLTRFPHEVEGT